jgi:streptogramin lyase
MAFVLPGDDIQTGLVMTGVGLQGHFHVVVLAGVAGGLDSAQSTIDVYLSPAGTSSIKAAIEGDKTLGGTCDTLWVDSISDYDVVEYNDNKYMGAIIKVMVVAITK